MSLNAASVLARLNELGHDSNIMKQTYRAEIAGQQAEMYDPNSLNDAGEPAAVSVRASDVDYYASKGFLTARPERAKKGGR